MPGCDHPYRYETPEALSELHWKKSCQGFPSIYRLCKWCKVQMVKGSEHNCVSNLKQQIEDFRNEYDQLKETIEEEEKA